MKFFKDQADILREAERAAETGRQANIAGEEINRQMTAGQTPGSFDASAPEFEPVQGIDLEKYAQLCKLITRESLPDEAAVDARLAGEGVPAGQWKAIAAEWNKRMGTHPAVMNQYAIMFGNA
jgi:hypothetical protein